jgi:hypothetical protein
MVDSPVEARGAGASRKPADRPFSLRAWYDGVLASGEKWHAVIRKRLGTDMLVATLSD